MTPSYFVSSLGTGGGYDPSEGIRRCEPMEFTVAPVLGPANDPDW